MKTIKKNMYMEPETIDMSLDTDEGYSSNVSKEIEKNQYEDNQYEDNQYEDNQYEDNLQKIETNIANKILSMSKDEYKNYIKKKNIVEKRKFLTFLLILFSNLNMNQIVNLTINNFLKLVTGNKVKIALDRKPSLYGNYSLKPYSLKLFIPDLYSIFVDGKDNYDNLLCSILNKNLIPKHNLRKDFNEVVVGLLFGDSIKKRLIS
uniref:hypothetical protein n=1 Tax=Ulva meridionalis TaxID=434723 RepID=UPI0028E0A441|nr:hypothetical protein NQY40_pgp079 [Ulva meridionalis]WFS80032.1 hypothetical protein [Ulva meridionalis]